MSRAPIDAVRAIFDETTLAHRRFAGHGLPGVVEAAVAISRALGAGGKVLVFGNGGSAADAQHFAAELVGRFLDERRPLSALALTADSSVVTAIANDYGYVHVFTRQVEALGSAGDIAFGISTSGRSPNVEAALAAARACGMVTIALTGNDGGRMGLDADLHLNVPETSVPRIQEVHRTILHAICALIENGLALQSGELGH